MALNTELLLTLKNLDGCGNKTVLAIAESMSSGIRNIEDLCNKWKTLKGKKFEKHHTEDLIRANRLALQIIQKSEEEGIGVLGYYDDRYPDMLRRTLDEKGKVDAPLILFYRGSLEALTKPSITIIGTREPTPTGEKAGIFFAEKFAKAGFNIVSGLALGCDTTAHLGALKAKGTTTAFLSGGLDWDSIYPKENLKLAKQIVANGGLLLSEYPIGQSGNRYSLVARDRLQAGLSQATVVVQTTEKGGTMHAVATTLLAHKPLYMVKYKNEEELLSIKVAGNNKYIAEKKAMALTSENLVEVLDSLANHTEKSSFSQLPKEQNLFE